MKNHDACSSSIVKLSDLKILEKAFEFKGMLLSSEEYWTNLNINETKNDPSSGIEIKEKINVQNTSEIKCSITTNDSFSCTQNSEYDINHFIKDEILDSKNEENTFSGKLGNLNLSSNKTEHYKDTIDNEFEGSSISKIINFQDNLNLERQDKMEIKHPLLHEKIKFNQSNNKNNFGINNLQINLEVLANLNNQKQIQINKLKVIKSLDNHNNNIMKIARNEKRKRKNKTKTEWTRMDDIKIIELVEIYYFDWQKIASIMNKPEDLIRQRYEKRLDPRLKFTKFSPEEDNAIINLYKIYGSTWNYISKFFPNRTSIMIKNRFYSSLKKRILMEKMVVLDKNKDLKIEDIQLNDLNVINNLNNEEKGNNKQNSINTFKNNNLSIIRDKEGAYKCAIKERKNLISSNIKVSSKENNYLKSVTNSKDYLNELNNLPKINLSSTKTSESNQNIIKRSIDQFDSIENEIPNENVQGLIKTNDIEGFGNFRKNSLNEIIFNDLDSLSVKSSFNCFFEKIDVAKEKSLRESDEIKIFSNLNNPKNAFDFQEYDHNAFEKITTNYENDSYNYSSIVNELLNNANINIDSQKDFSFLDSEFLSEEDLVENINKIYNHKLFIESALKNLEKELSKNSANKLYQEVKVQILKKIEFLVQVIRKLKTKIEKITK